MNIWTFGNPETSRRKKNMKTWKYENFENLKIWKYETMKIWEYEKVENMKIWKYGNRENSLGVKIWKENLKI